MKSATKSILCRALLSLVICAGTDGKTKTQIPTEQASPTQAEGSGDVLKTFRTYFVKSDTIYMKAGTLQRALEGRADFVTWGLQAVNESKNADVTIEVQLPFLSWEWKYRMIQVPAGAVLATGKVKALTEDIAAPQLAAQIAERLNEVRGKPSNAKQEMDSLTVDREREAALPSKEWRVDYISGITDTKLGKGTLTTNRDQITCRTRNGSSFTILAKDVVVVTHDSQKTHMDWPSVWDAANPMGETMASTLGTSLIMVPIALVGGAIVETLPAEQFVRIDWREAGVLEHVVFQTGNYKALLKEMRAITHTKEIDISAEAELIREELAKPDRQSWLVKLNRAAQVGWAVLPAGAYEVVFLPHEGTLGAVYFFPSAAHTTSRPAAQAVVHVETRADPSAQTSTGEQARFASVQYRVENGISRITEISRGNRTWQFTLAPLTLEAPQD